MPPLQKASVARNSNMKAPNESRETVTANGMIRWAPAVVGAAALALSIWAWRSAALPATTLLVGILAAFMLTVTLHLARKANLRAREAEQAHREAARQAEQLLDAKRKLERFAVELAKKNDELALALAAAKEATEMRGRFLAAVSHEIRTPMNGILGMTELLLCSGLNREQRHYSEAIRESTEQLLRIVNDVLDYSKIEAGKLEIVTAPFNLKTTLRAVKALLLPQASAKGLSLVVKLATDVPDWVAGDAGRLRQVLLNLVGNAVKFTQHGGVTIEVDLLQSDAGGDLFRFTVTDTGIGIPPEQLPVIFEEYRQVDISAGRRYEGTGLGLNISKQLVEMMGGELECESTPGSGSSFWFTLPLVRSAPPVSESHPADRETKTAFEPPPRRVLVVEDNKVNRVVAIGLLSRLNCRVTAVEDGLGAIRTAAGSEFDLILMDVNLPGLDGFETTARIRRQEEPGRHTPIIAMTARAMAGDRQLCLEAGMDDYVSKPLSLADLRLLLERWPVNSSPQPVE